MNASAGTSHKLAQRLGYDFRDPALLHRAITHSSRGGAQRDYERLEFLGDRVLGLIIAEELYRRNPKAREGDLAPRLSALVRGDLCAEVARQLELHQFIAVGLGEARAGLAPTANMLGDAMEAVIGGIYLDGGLEAARGVVLGLWEPFLAEQAIIRKDAKTFLQEWALARALALPAYAVTARQGPDHAPRFLVEVRLNGHAPAHGEGASKRIAEQDAAQAFLLREGIRS